MTVTAVILLIAVAFRITKIIVNDVIFDRPRYWLSELHPDVDMLISCFWCAGTWVSLAVLGVAALAIDYSSVYQFLGLWALTGTTTGFLGDFQRLLDRVGY